MSFHRSFATPVVVLRPFNTYGPRQSDRAVIPTIIGQLAAGARTLALGALTPTRDFNFVADTVRGFIAAAEAPAQQQQQQRMRHPHRLYVGSSGEPSTLSSSSSDCNETDMRERARVEFGADAMALEQFGKLAIVQ